MTAAIRMPRAAQKPRTRRSFSLPLHSRYSPPQALLSDAIKDSMPVMAARGAAYSAGAAVAISTSPPRAICDRIRSVTFTRIHLLKVCANATKSASEREAEESSIMCRLVSACVWQRIFLDITWLAMPQKSRHRPRRIERTANHTTKRLNELVRSKVPSRSTTRRSLTVSFSCNLSTTGIL